MIATRLAMISCRHHAHRPRPPTWVVGEAERTTIPTRYGTSSISPGRQALSNHGC
jgi:hypothetical protein